uniref:VOC domain-containing protein n=1 Tax=Kalanchoe fedtschenkoi TaxID=63787 RepID=A0A7N0UXR9_KALFE
MVSEIQELCSYEALPMLSLNHVSLLCNSVRASTQFYRDVLGFIPIKRPSTFNFNGAWLYNYGIGIHLLENPSRSDLDKLIAKRPINPKDNHISFQCSDIGTMKRRLEAMEVKYAMAVVEDDEGNVVEQAFFHDPDGYMIEICNCEKIPIRPISYNPFIIKDPETCKRRMMNDSGLVMELKMMESLSMDLMNFSF